MVKALRLLIYVLRSSISSPAMLVSPTATTDQDTHQADDSIHLKHVSHAQDP